MVKHERIPPLSRRDVLAGAFAGLAAGFVLAKDAADFLEKRHAPEIYREGDSFEAGGVRVRVRGWKLLFDAVAVRPGVNFKFDLHNPALPPNDIPEVSSSHIAYLQAARELPGSIDMLPEVFGEDIILTYTEEQPHGNGVKMETEFFRIQPRYFTGPVESRMPVRDFYESDLSANAKRDSFEQREAFRPFADGYVLYVHDELPEDIATTYPETSQIHLDLNLFRNPLFKDNGLAAAFHERSHLVRKTIQYSDRYQPQYVALQEAYEGMVRASGPLVSDGEANDYEYRITGPVGLFDIVTESTYAAPHRKRAKPGSPPGNPAYRFGHPYDDANELFASTSTILRFFPDAFLERYAALQGTEKEAVRKTAQAVLDAFCSMVIEEGKVAAVFPNFRRIAKAVGFEHTFFVDTL